MRNQLPEFAWDAFLSYCDADSRAVVGLIQPWITDGFRCYQDAVDEASFPGGPTRTGEDARKYERALARLKDLVRRSRDFVLFLSERSTTFDHKIRWRLQEVERLIRSERQFRVVHFVMLEAVDVTIYRFGALSQALVVDLSDARKKDAQVDLLARQLRVPTLLSVTGREKRLQALGGVCLVDLIVEGPWANFGAVDRINIERDIAGESYNSRSPRIASTSPQGKDAVRITVLAEENDLPGLESIEDKLLAGKRVLRPPQVRPFLAHALDSSK
jgi:hypothetical protein